MSSIRKLLSPGKSSSRASTPDPETTSQRSRTASASGAEAGDRALVTVRSGERSIGSATQSETPASAPILDEHGAPVTAMDESAADEVSATIASPGLTDLGPEGERSLRAAQTDSLGRGGQDAGDVVRLRPL